MHFIHILFFASTIETIKSIEITKNDLNISVDENNPTDEKNKLKNIEDSLSNSAYSGEESTDLEELFTVLKLDPKASTKSPLRISSPVTNHNINDSKNSSNNPTGRQRGRSKKNMNIETADASESVSSETSTSPKIPPKTKDLDDFLYADNNKHLEKNVEQTELTGNTNSPMKSTSNTDPSENESVKSKIKPKISSNKEYSIRNNPKSSDRNDEGNNKLKVLRKKANLSSKIAEDGKESNIPSKEKKGENHRKQNGENKKKGMTSEKVTAERNDDVKRTKGEEISKQKSSGKRRNNKSKNINEDYKENMNIENSKSKPGRKFYENEYDKGHSLGQTGNTDKIENKNKPKYADENEEDHKKATNSNYIGDDIQRSALKNIIKNDPIVCRCVDNVERAYSTGRSRTGSFANEKFERRGSPSVNPITTELENYIEDVSYPDNRYMSLFGNHKQTPFISRLPYQNPYRNIFNNRRSIFRKEIYGR